MRPRKLLQRLLDGNYANVRFSDFQQLVEACGFDLERVAGSHHIYSHQHMPVKLNIQAVRGRAKPYQLRQFRLLAERYDLIPEGLQ